MTNPLLAELERITLTRPARPKVESYAPKFRVELIRDGDGVPTQIVETPQTAADVMKVHLGRVADEHLVLILLDTNQMLIGTQTIAMGEVKSCPASVKKVMRTVLLSNAAGFIVGHNHPAGRARPSPEDVKFFKKLQAACAPYDGEIKFLDAIIIGDGTNEVYSHGSATYDLR